jgi:hypothetical protein
MRKVVLMGAIILAQLGAAPAALAGDTTSGWTISEEISPLTNEITVTGSVESTKDLLNMLARPEKASLIIRCSEETLAAYVAWPEVLSRGMAEFAQTTVLYKIDDQPIKTDYWDIAKGGVSAGGFDSIKAIDILNALDGGKRRVVRMTGRIAQDAIFDITGISPIIAKTKAACGLDANALPSAMPLGVPDSPGASVEINHPVPHLLAVANDVLEAAGYYVVKRDEASGALSTAALDINISTKMANCGKSWGIPYLLESDS